MSFDAADVNNDGVIDRREFERFLASQGAVSGSGPSMSVVSSRGNSDSWVSKVNELKSQLQQGKSSIRQFVSRVCSFSHPRAITYASACHFGYLKIFARN